MQALREFQKACKASEIQTTCKEAVSTFPPLLNINTCHEEIAERLTLSISVSGNSCSSQTVQPDACIVIGIA